MPLLHHSTHFVLFALPTKTPNLVTLLSSYMQRRPYASANLQQTKSTDNLPDRFTPNSTQWQSTKHLDNLDLRVARVEAEEQHLSDSYLRIFPLHRVRIFGRCRKQCERCYPFLACWSISARWKPSGLFAFYHTAFHKSEQSAVSNTHSLHKHVHIQTLTPIIIPQCISPFQLSLVSPRLLWFWLRLYLKAASMALRWSHTHTYRMTAPVPRTKRAHTPKENTVH